MTTDPTALLYLERTFAGLRAVPGVWSLPLRVRTRRLQVGRKVLPRAFVHLSAKSLSGEGPADQAVLKYLLGVGAENLWLPHITSQ